MTGAGGFLGVHLVRGLAAAGADVTGLVRRPVDAATRDFLTPVASRVTWHEGDVTDRPGMAELLAGGVDVVVHAAAVTATPQQERDAPARVFDVNAGGTLNLLEAVRRSPPRRFVLLSSGGLYGPAPPSPALDETAPLRGDSMYAIAKIAAERLTLRYSTLVGLDVAIGRLGTTYGPLERPSGSRSNLSAIQQAIDAMRAAAPGGSVPVRGADVARDFLHVDDAVDAFVPRGGANARPARRERGCPGRPAAVGRARRACAGERGRLARGGRRRGGHGRAGRCERPGRDGHAPGPPRELGWRFRYDLASGTVATWTPGRTAQSTRRSDLVSPVRPHRPRDPLEPTDRRARRDGTGCREDDVLDDPSRKPRLRRHSDGHPRPIDVPVQPQHRDLRSRVPTDGQGAAREVPPRIARARGRVGDERSVAGHGPPARLHPVDSRLPRGRPIACVGSVAHVSDVGGHPGEIEGEDVFSEGLRLPPCKLVEAGHENALAFDLIGANTRAPDLLLGDLRAMIGAARIGGRAVREVLNSAGLESLTDLAEAILDRSEAHMRRRLRELPDGTYRAAMEIDGYVETVRLEVAVTVENGEATVDFEGTSPAIAARRDQRPVRKHVGDRDLPVQVRPGKRDPEQRRDCFDRFASWRPKAASSTPPIRQQ